jgi:Double zinc ribbon
MLSPRCQHENRDGARFCGACGASLEGSTACPRCGTLNPPGQNFCGACGAGLSARAGASAPAIARDARTYTPRHLVDKILTTRSALEGERKQVSVLFADLVDSCGKSRRPCATAGPSSSRTFGPSTGRRGSEGPTTTSWRSLPSGKRPAGSCCASSSERIARSASSPIPFASAPRATRSSPRRSCRRWRRAGASGERGAYRLTAPVDSLAMPETVQSLLAARIDRLGEPAKHVLQAAAVIGKQFDEPLLREVSGLGDRDLGAALGELQEGDFLRLVTASLRPEYAFRHPLMGDAAYRSQLGERRARLHAAVATALEKLHADRLGEYAALIAHHWEASGVRFEAARWKRRAALRVASIKLASMRVDRRGQSRGPKT